MKLAERIRWLFGLRPPHPRGACFRGCERCPDGARPWERLYALGGEGPRGMAESTTAADLVQQLLETGGPPASGWRPIPLDPCAPWHEAALAAGLPRRNGKTELGFRAYAGALLAQNLVNCECTEAPPVLRGAAPGLEVRLGPWAPFEDESVVDCIRALEVRTDRLRRRHFPLPCPLHPEPRS